MSQRDNLELQALPDMLTYVSLGVWCPNLAPWFRCFAQDEITALCGWLPSTAPRQNTVTAPSLQMWHFCFILALLTFKIPVQSRHKFKSEVTQGLLWILAVLHTCYLYKFNKCGKREEAHLWEILMQLIKLIFNPTVQKLRDIHTDCKVNCISQGGLCEQHGAYIARSVPDWLASNPISSSTSPSNYSCLIKYFVHSFMQQAPDIRLVEYKGCVF